LRVLLCPIGFPIGVCRRLFERVPAPRWIF